MRVNATPEETLAVQPGIKPAAFSDHVVVLGSLDTYHESTIVVETQQAALKGDAGVYGQILLAEGNLYAWTLSGTQMLQPPLRVGPPGGYGVNVQRDGDADILHVLQAKESTVDGLKGLETFRIAIWPA